MLTIDDIGAVLGFVETKLMHWALSPGSSFSLGSLASALFIAVSVLLIRRRAGRREVSLKLMVRALFPKWLYRHRSFRTDVGLLLFNLFAWGLLFGWTAISATYYSNLTAEILQSLLGPSPHATMPTVVTRLLATVALFLAYELGYWTHHYFSHRIPLLWEFHKVHHTAEILTPMTNYRVHPIDTAVFYNVMALFLGTSAGLLAFVLGAGADVFAIDGTNVILVGFIFTLTHLQHSHLWIPATGRLARMLLSPAHHQLHHSTNPLHFNKNFGSCLAVWDWVFGTLQIPTRERQRLTFGLEPLAGEHHTAVGAMVMPVIEALAKTIPRGRRAVASPSSIVES